ncbi:MAG: signal recognition particle subunit SRP19/SEC65 family protein [Thermoplasmatota archaeon]|nr:signal recognition particle subunit SRP19/SEC65 family protein [Halobacteriales archaeon]
MVSKGAERFVLYPRYFDAKLSRADGRRVAESLAVKAPDAAWIENAARKLGLEPQVEEKKAHSAVPFEKGGRVLVAKKGSKEAVIRMVAERMRAAQDARSSE